MFMLLSTCMQDLMNSLFLLQLSILIKSVSMSSLSLRLFACLKVVATSLLSSSSTSVHLNSKWSAVSSSLSHKEHRGDGTRPSL